MRTRQSNPFEAISSANEPDLRAPTQLRIEHLEEPLGIDVARPRLSWWLPLGAGEQKAYRLRTDDWDSGRVDSEQSLLVDFAGPPLVSRQRVECAVKVWTDKGESEWSRPVCWEMGLLHPSDWTARWIEPPEGKIPPIGQRPAWRLRHEFNLAQTPCKARLYATAHGLYEIYLNEVRVGDVELTPGYTAYAKILQAQTYGVLELLRAGMNTIDVVLSDGWYRGQVGAFRQINQYGDRVAFLAQLELRFDDGSQQIVATGDDWVARTGAVLAADLMQGVRIDFRLKDDTPARQERSPWAPVRVANHDLTRLRASPSPPVRRMDEIAPADIRALDRHRQIIDMGRNIAGWLKLTDLGPSGSQLRLTYAEALDERGDVTTDNIDSTANAAELSLPEAAKMPDGIGPLQVDEIISAGSEHDVFEPRMSTKGFRYVRVEGQPKILSRDDVRGVVVHSDLRRTGWFECSNERLNRLHEAAVQTLKANMVDIPTD
jgi:alpha-L-rhamnosidase